MPKYKYDAIGALQKCGISEDDARALRRISMTLRRWYEHECNGTIQRDEETKIPYWYTTENTYWQKSGKRLFRTPDREAGALRRLKTIMARYPTLDYYLQGDPRGCALYVLRPGDVPAGADKGSYYPRGIAVY